MSVIILGNLQALEQLKKFLNSIDSRSYTQTAKPYLGGTIGEHSRHLLDMYQALHRYLKGEAKVIDYTFRRRGGALERIKDAAISEISTCEQWLSEINISILQETIQVRMETQLSHQVYSEPSSTLERELNFCSEHLIHHLSTIAIIAKFLDLSFDEPMGIAPSTLSHLRGEDV